MICLSIACRLLHVASSMVEATKKLLRLCSTILVSYCPQRTMESLLEPCSDRSSHLILLGCLTIMKCSKCTITINKCNLRATRSYGNYIQTNQLTLTLCNSVKIMTRKGEFFNVQLPLKWFLSFDPNYSSMELTDFVPVVHRVFNRDPYWHSLDHPKRGAVTG